jgi:hypothetical protein
LLLGTPLTRVPGTVKKRRHGGGAAVGGRAVFPFPSTTSPDRNSPSSTRPPPHRLPRAPPAAASPPGHAGQARRARHSLAGAPAGKQSDAAGRRGAHDAEPRARRAHDMAAPDAAAGGGSDGATVPEPPPRQWRETLWGAVRARRRRGRGGAGPRSRARGARAAPHSPPPRPSPPHPTPPHPPPPALAVDEPVLFPFHQLLRRRGHAAGRGDRVLLRLPAPQR